MNAIRIPLRGIRWKCLHCDSYDLCTVCYMADEHNVSHIFSRIQSEDSKGKEMPARFDVTLTGYAFALGAYKRMQKYQAFEKITEKEELVKKGFRIFERGDTNPEESEIKYFIRMAEYVLDEKVLPVIISIRNGGLNEDVLVSASNLLLPIIRLKKSSPDVTVLTLENGSIEKATELMTNLKTPWTVRKSETFIVIKNAETTEEISAINDVRIRHILVGCKILQDASDDKKNEQIQRETSQRLKLYFTERATLITRFIHEATSYNDLVENELDESVNHAGRLLVNHGYIEDAIRTKNKAFLDNKTVTEILNKMWYGEEKSLFRKVLDKYTYSITQSRN
ncbi:MIB [Mytilus edulis]|uniref:MIB n=1 Tax=Mytilus edulis TaxID=6550 RepID=A0A8S3VGH9_MYTED|nr:MIB [Mytilus edulis]